MPLLFDETGDSQDDNPLNPSWFRVRDRREVREEWNDVDFGWVDTVGDGEYVTIVFGDCNNRPNIIKCPPEQARVGVVVQLICMNGHADRIVGEATTEVANEQFVIAKMAVDEAESLLLCRSGDENGQSKIHQPAEYKGLPQDGEIPLRIRHECLKVGQNEGGERDLMDRPTSIWRV